MTTKTDGHAPIRAALDAVPCVKWTASRSTVHIPETDDWAGKDLHITGLDKQVARKLARYIADTHPEAVRALLAERDALREALEAAMECGMVPSSSVKDGGANRYVRQAQVADMIRAALAQGQGERDAA